MRTYLEVKNKKWKRKKDLHACKKANEIKGYIKMEVKDTIAHRTHTHTHTLHTHYTTLANKRMNVKHQQNQQNNEQKWKSGEDIAKETPLLFKFRAKYFPEDASDEMTNYKLLPK